MAISRFMLELAWCSHMRLIVAGLKPKFGHVREDRVGRERAPLP